MCGLFVLYLCFHVFAPCFKLKPIKFPVSNNKGTFNLDKDILMYRNPYTDAAINLHQQLALMYLFAFTTFVVF